jgi:UDP-N-acetylglucosamine 2-epimerase (non-hydrolysing)
LAGVHVVCVAGTRPNLVKLAPVVAELERREVHTTFVDAAQHYDDVLSGEIRRDLGLRDPDVVLHTGSGTHAEQLARVSTSFEPLLADLAPDWTFVFGDVNTTLGCALVAAKAPTRLGHVEAGLRSGDRTMPEEVNRRAVDAVSDVLFAPSEDAVATLLAEGAPPACVHLVGNTMIDSLVAALPAARARHVPERLGLPDRYVVATLHRPSNVDDPATLRRLLEVLGRVGSDAPVVLPAHPRLQARLGQVPPGVVLVDPLGYLDFIGLADRAALVLTDSGGVQEETTVLGVPCLTVRTTTERPVTITEGTNRVVGTDPAVVLAAARDALAAPAPTRRVPACWDGRAAARVVDVVCP